MIPTPLAWSTAASDIKAARNIENSVGAITQPCFTPVLILNDPDCSPSNSTHAFMPSCSCRVMLTNLGGHPSRARHAHRAYVRRIFPQFPHECDDMDKYKDTWLNVPK